MPAVGMWDTKIFISKMIGHVAPSCRAEAFTKAEALAQAGLAAPSCRAEAFTKAEALA
jgi:hypothetical protein